MGKILATAGCAGLLIMLAIGCKKNPVNVDPPLTQKDTSIFIGTWAMVFDTSDSEKYDFWWTGTSFLEPDTVSYMNDTLSISRRGLEGGYYYTKDSIYSYELSIGKESKTGSRYYLKNDTLIFNPDTSKYVPVYKKVP